MASLNCIITGGSDGLGKSLVLELTNSGHTVITIGRDKDKLEEVKKNNINKITGFVGDLTIGSTIQEFSSLIKKKYPVVDVLINNAGYQIGNKFLSEASLEDIDKMISIHVKSPLLLYQSLYSQFKPGALIINIISNTVNNYLKETYGPYTISKYAEYGLGKIMIKEAAKKDLRVTNVVLGGVETNIRNSPRPDYLKPEEAAKAVAALLQIPEAVYVPEICIYPKINVL